MSLSPKLEYEENPWSKETQIYQGESEHSDDDSGDSGNGSKRRRNFVRTEDSKRSKALTSEGFCSEHDIPQHLRCMTCEKWICGVCSTLHHKSCRTLLVSEAMKELEIDSLKNAKITAEWVKDKITCIEKLSETYEQKKKDLLETVQYHQEQLEVESRKLEDIEPINNSINGIKEQLRGYEVRKEEGTVNFDDSRHLKENIESDVQIVESELDRLEKSKNGHMPRGLNNKMNKYELFCHMSASNMYVVKTEGSRTQYGRLSVKDKMVKIHSFQNLPPSGEQRLIEFNECLESLTGACKTPKVAFLEISVNDRKLGDLICQIFSRGSREEEAFTILCLGTGNVSFKGITLWLGGTAYVYAPNLTVQTGSKEQSTERRHPEMGDIQAISTLSAGGTEMGVNFWTRMNNKKYTNAGYLGKIRTGMEFLQAAVQEMLASGDNNSSVTKLTNTQNISSPNPSSLLGSYHGASGMPRLGYDMKSEGIRPNQNGGLRGADMNTPQGRGYGPASMGRFDDRLGPRPLMGNSGYGANNLQSQQHPMRGLMPPMNLRGNGNGAMRGLVPNMGPRGFRPGMALHHSQQPRSHMVPPGAGPRPLMTSGANPRPLMGMPRAPGGQGNLNQRFSLGSTMGSRPSGPVGSNSMANGSKPYQAPKKVKVTDCGLIIDMDFI